MAQPIPYTSYATGTSRSAPALLLILLLVFAAGGANAAMTHAASDPRRNRNLQMSLQNIPCYHPSQTEPVPLACTNPKLQQILGVHAPPSGKAQGTAYYRYDDAQFVGDANYVVTLETMLVVCHTGLVRVGLYHSTCHIALRDNDFGLPRERDQECELLHEVGEVGGLDRDGCPDRTADSVTWRDLGRAMIVLTLGNFMLLSASWGWKKWKKLAGTNAADADANGGADQPTQRTDVESGTGENGGGLRRRRPPPAADDRVVSRSSSVSERTSEPSPSLRGGPAPQVGNVMNDPTSNLVLPPDAIYLEGPTSRHGPSTTSPSSSSAILTGIILHNLPHDFPTTNAAPSVSGYPPPQRPAPVVRVG